MHVTILCPWCGEPNEIWIDPTGGAKQIYVEDCQTCCQAWQVTVRPDDDGEPSVSIEPL
jgi:hypothetical protein